MGRIFDCCYCNNIFSKKLSSYYFEPNMATTQVLINRLVPDVFDGRMDLETFIMDCRRFFDIANIEENARGLMIKTMINRELIPIYEAVEINITGFEERLRKAFQKPSSLINDMKEIMEYRKGSNTAEKFFEDVNRMTEKLLRHKWDKNELTKYFLIHCVDDKEIQKEIKMRETTDVEEIEKIIKKMDNIMMEEEVAPIKRLTFAEIARGEKKFREYQNKNMRPVNVRVNQKPQMKNIICWTCGQEGHISRNCRRIPNIRCYACNEEGHIRRNCQKIKCDNCHRSGHIEKQCYFKTGFQGYQFRNRFDPRTHRVMNNNSNQYNFYSNKENRNRNEDYGKYSRNSVFREYKNEMDINKENRVAVVDDNYYDDLQDTFRSNYPKDEAPPCEEMIGAMQ